MPSELPGLGTGRGDRHFRWTPAGRMGLVRSRSSIDLPASPELQQARRAALDGQIFLPGPCVLRSESLASLCGAALPVPRLRSGPLIEGSASRLNLNLRLPFCTPIFSRKCNLNLR